MVNYLYTLDYQVDSDGQSPGNRTGGDNNGKAFEILAPLVERTLPEETVSEAGGQKDGITAAVDQLELSESSSPGPNPLSFHILMYSLADRMFIQGLKVLSEQRVEQGLVQQLVSDSFPQAIQEIYLSTPPHDRGLRDVAVRVTIAHLTTLRISIDTSSMVLQNSFLESHPQFSKDLLVAIMDKSITTWNQGYAVGRDFGMKAGF